MENLQFFWGFAVGVAVLTFFIHCIFAVAVYIDSEKLTNRDKSKPVLVPGLVWATATLVLGPLMAIGYWVIHRTSIANLEEKRPEEFDIEDYLA